jgi:hypothetical protein
MPHICSISRGLQLLSAAAIVAGVASPLIAFNPRGGHTKVVVSKNLMMKPNASAAAMLIEKGGGEIVQEYETQTLAYFLTESLKSLADRAAQLGVEIRVREDFDQVFLPEGTVDARKGVAGSLPGLHLSAPYKKGESGVYLLQFAGPILPEWEKQVESLGVKLVQYIPYNAYLAAATPEAMTSAGKLPFVQLSDRFHLALKIHPTTDQSGEARDLIVQLMDAAGVDAFVSSFSARSTGKAATTRRVSAGELQLHGTFDPRDLPDILDSPLVFGVVEEPVVQPSDERVALSVTKNVSGAADARVLAAGSPGTYKNWLASLCPFCTFLQDDHFWLGVADKGVDDGTTSGRHNPSLNPDPSKPKVRFGSNLDFSVFPQTPAGVSSHGTMIAGVAAGDPPTATASDKDPSGYFYGTGVAPSAGVYVTKIYPGIPQGSPSYTPVADSASDAANPPDNFDTVRVQNHSFNDYYHNPGRSTCYGGVYSLLSQQFDYSVLDADNGTHNSTKEPMVLTVSAGNQLNQLSNGDPCASSRSWTLPPGTAKNVISVGSTEVPRSSSEQWQCHYCGQTSLENIAADSMRGTANPGWYKPDLFAPAENIVSTRSVTDTGNGNDQCGPTNTQIQPLDNQYIAGGGTSFAAPVAAGAALLARRFYEEVVNPGCHGSSSSPCSPDSATPALTKAMLIAGARSMANGKNTTLRYDSSAVPAITRFDQGVILPFPNSQQGFGRINLEDVLSSYPIRYFVNEGTSATTLPTATWSKQLTVHDPTLPVKIALVWSDPPAALADQQSTTTIPLVNDLNLRVSLATSPCTRYVGNQLGFTTGHETDEVSLDYCNNGAPPWDTVNNVEIARFFAPAGTTTFTVSVDNASGVGHDPQSFALVAYNAYDASISAPPGTPVLTDITTSGSVALSWSAVAGTPTGYEIRRKAAGTNGFVTLATVATPGYTDSGLPANASYVYQVRSLRSPYTSAWSSPDLATTVTPTHVVLGGIIAASKIVQLRALVNAVRSTASLPMYSPQPPSNPDGSLAGGIIHLEDISQLRAALDEARATLGVSALSYTDQQLTHQSTRVKAIHLNELMDGVQ